MSVVGEALLNAAVRAERAACAKIARNTAAYWRELAGVGNTRTISSQNVITGYLACADVAEEIAQTIEGQ